MSRQNPLVNKAQLNELIYNELYREVPENDDGVKQAYLEDEDGNLVVTVPEETDYYECTYGDEPVTIADIYSPYSLARKASGTDLSSIVKKKDKDLLRKILRTIVDEV